MPKINILSMIIVYHYILQVHSCAIETCSCLATAPTSLICCKVSLATKDLSFMYLHNMNITIVVT